MGRAAAFPLLSPTLTGLTSSILMAQFSADPGVLGLSLCLQGDRSAGKQDVKEHRDLMEQTDSSADESDFMK